MKKQVLKILLVSVVFGFQTVITSAKDCSWLPSFICDLVSSDDAVGVIEARIRAAFFIAIGVIVLIAIAYGIFNAYKYIKSGGGDGMKDANSGMQGILFGIGSIFVIILGIVAVLLFFGAKYFEVMLAPSCINSPAGIGCFACQNQGLGVVAASNMTMNQSACNTCNNNPNSEVTLNIQARDGYELKYILNGSPYQANQVALKCSQTVTEVIKQ